MDDVSYWWTVCFTNEIQWTVIGPYDSYEMASGVGNECNSRDGNVHHHFTATIKELAKKLYSVIDIEKAVDHLPGRMFVSRYGRHIVTINRVSLAKILADEIIALSKQKVLVDGLG